MFDKTTGSRGRFGDSIILIKRIPAFAGAIHSDVGFLRQMKKAIRLTLNSLRYRSEVSGYLRSFDNPALSEILILFPALLEKPFEPYVCVNWAVIERFRQLEQHFEFLKNSMGTRAAQIYLPAGYTLFEFDANDGGRYSVQLFPGYQNEGSIGIRLCDEKHREVYALSLHFSGTTRNVLTIGALQGPNDRIPDRQKVITQLTRSLHGLRPKALMIEVMYMLVEPLKIDAIFGITNAGHIYQSARFSDEKRSQVMFDFDQLWREYRGAVHCVSFYKLPAAPLRKELTLLKSSKRSLYRKRYAWLNGVSLDVSSAINDLLIDKTEMPDYSRVDKAA